MCLRVNAIYQASLLVGVFEYIFALKLDLVNGLQLKSYELLQHLFLLDDLGLVEIVHFLFGWRLQPIITLSELRSRLPDALEIGVEGKLVFFAGLHQALENFHL